MEAMEEVDVQQSDYYKSVRNEYKILSAANPSQKEYMTKQWVGIMIQRIVAAEAIATNEGEESLHESVKDTLRSYAIERNRFVTTLLAKPLPGEEHFKTIVPLEGSYDVIRLAHNATKHGTPREMEDWLVRNNYKVHIMCSEIYCRLCLKCSTTVFDVPAIQNLDEQNKAIQMIAVDVEQEIKEENEPSTSIIKDDDVFTKMFRKEESFQHVCSIDILNLTENPDQFYNYLLIYQDRKTKFVQLRPLTNSSEMEISVELIKILMDFSCPECMVVDADNKTVFQNIGEKIKVLTGFDIALALHKSENKLIKTVAKNIVRWMETADCKNWGTGCHIVQWKMNNTADSEGETPFSKIFGYRYTGGGFKSKFMLSGNEHSDDDGMFSNIDQDDDVSGKMDQQVQTVNDTSEKETYLITMTEVEKTEENAEEELSNSPVF